MRKAFLRFSILIPLFALVLAGACENDQPVYVDETAPNVVYSSDWRLITIYLNGIVPLNVKTGVPNEPKDRAMTVDTARWGFNYFEVVFYYKGITSIDKWEIGKRCSVDGIYRNGPGIDYSAVNMESVEGTDNGCALLFAGRDNDKSLLGVGKIVFVDDEPGAVIKESSLSVTFEISAFTGGVAFDAEKSSFLTNTGNNDEVSPENTKIINALLGSKRFPLYVLPCLKTVKAQYKFGISNGKDDILYTDEEKLENPNDVYNYNDEYNGTYGDWSQYEKSIIIVGAGKADKRKARYPAGNGHYFYPRYGEDQTTIVNITNNSAIGEYFVNTVELEIDTRSTYNTAKPEDNGIFTFAFSIPVYPLSAELSSGVEDCWYIRPAYSSAYYNIDNGITGNMVNISNNGGGVLIGVGVAGNEFEIPADLR